MPRARPLTTTRPAAASSRPRERPTARPYAEQARAPTTATDAAARSSTLADPRMKRPGGRVVDRAEQRRDRRTPSDRRSERRPLRVERARPARRSRVGTMRSGCPPGAARDGDQRQTRTRRGPGRSPAPQLLGRAVRERLGEVLGLDADPTQQARRSCGRLARRACGRGPRAAAVRPRGREARSLPQCVPAARHQVAAGPRPRGLAPLRALAVRRGQLGCARSRHRDDEVEPVEQRA